MFRWAASSTCWERLSGSSWICMRFCSLDIQAGEWSWNLGLRLPSFCPGIISVHLFWCQRFLFNHNKHTRYNLGTHSSWHLLEDLWIRLRYYELELDNRLQHCIFIVDPHMLLLRPHITDSVTSWSSNLIMFAPVMVCWFTLIWQHYTGLTIISIGSGSVVTEKCGASNTVFLLLDMLCYEMCFSCNGRFA